MAEVGVIIGCAIGAVVLIIIIVVLVYLLRSRREPGDHIASTREDGKKSNAKYGSNAEMEKPLVKSSDRKEEAKAQQKPEFVGSGVHQQKKVPASTTKAKSDKAANPEDRVVNAAHRDKEEQETYSEADFKVIAPLGSGGFGDVSLVQYKDSGRYFALKSMDKAVLLGQGNELYAYIERDIMTRLDHPNVLTLHGTFQSQTHLFYLMEFMAGGDLMGLLDSTPQSRLPLDAARFWMSELYLALRYLHGEGILYRDLKPENILLDHFGHSRLADFGLSKDFGNEEELLRRGAPSVVGSPYCMAPEVLLAQRRGNYDQSADWWSFGILLYRLLYGRYPFRGRTKQELFQNIVSQRLSFPEEVSFGEADVAVKDFLQGLLTKEKANRPSSSLIAEHSFWGPISWKDVVEWQIPVPKCFGEERKIENLKLPQVKKRNRGSADDLPPPRPFRGFTVQKGPLAAEDKVAKSGDPEGQAN